MLVGVAVENAARAGDRLVFRVSNVGFGPKGPGVLRYRLTRTVRSPEGGVEVLTHEGNTLASLATLAPREDGPREVVSRLPFALGGAGEIELCLDPDDQISERSDANNCVNVATEGFLADLVVRTALLHLKERQGNSFLDKLDDLVDSALKVSAPWVFLGATTAGAWLTTAYANAVVSCLPQCEFSPSFRPHDEVASFVVYNRGGTRAASSVAEIRLGAGDPIGSALIVRVPPLGPGEARGMTVVLNARSDKDQPTLGSEFRGCCSGSVTIDFERRIEESDESNNTTTLARDRRNR